MFAYLSKHFPRSHHYLVEERRQDDIDNFFIEKLFDPFGKGSKHTIWGEQAREFSIIGSRLGWVPDHVPVVFFRETVEHEIADALASKQNRLVGEENEIEQARFLLEQIGISDLSGQNPYFLSQGETKLVWFLSQWAKLPDYLVISYLPAGLSQQRINRLLAFLLNSEKMADFLKVSSPTFVLGYLDHDKRWYENLISEPNSKSRWIKRNFIF